MANEVTEDALKRSSFFFFFPILRMGGGDQSHMGFTVNPWGCKSSPMSSQCALHKVLSNDFDGTKKASPSSTQQPPFKGKNKTIE